MYATPLIFDSSLKTDAVCTTSFEFTYCSEEALAATPAATLNAFMFGINWANPSSRGTPDYDGLLTSVDFTVTPPTTSWDTEYFTVVSVASAT